MVGVPAFIHIFLIWLPTIGSIVLSFTNWNGVGGLDKIQFIGLKNYENLINTYPPFWPAVTHNLIWLVVFLFIATPLGMLMAVLLDQSIRGSRIYQSALYMPVVLSLAIVGFIWGNLMYSPGQGFINNFLATVSGDPKWVTPGTAIDWIGDQGLNLAAVLVAASWRHVGYIMVLYLAGLKSVDNTLREAAAIDGANGRQTFFRVVFPVLAPINVVVLVVTVIESLRAFDIVYVINKGLNGLELLSVLITEQRARRGEPRRVRVGDGRRAAADLDRADHLLPVSHAAGATRMTTRDVVPAEAVQVSAVADEMLAGRRTGVVTGKRRRPHYVTHAFLIVISAIWLFPLVMTIYTSFRPYGDTAGNARGYFSIGGAYNLDNYFNAASGMDLWLHLLQTMLVVVPAVFLILWFASMIAVAVSRYSCKLQHRAADDLHGRQPAAPAGRDHAAVPDVPRPAVAQAVLSDNGIWYDQLFGIVMIHLAFQLGFCTFVLSNYFKQIPKELNEAAVVDGASRLEDVHGRAAAAGAAGARRPCDARVHVDLQRLLLGGSC